MEAELAEIFGDLNAGRWESGAKRLTGLLGRDPGLIDGWFALAVAEIRCGRPRAAWVAFRNTLALAPGHAAIWSNLAVFGQTAGLAVDVESCAKRAVWADPGFVAARANLGVLRLRTGDRTAAAGLLREAAALAPDNQQAWSSLGEIAMDGGAAARALAWLLRARIIAPLPATAHSGLVFAAQFLSQLDGEAKDRIAADFARIHGGTPPPRRSRRSSPSRLRIGYVSPDFRHHACAYFLEPLLAAHDRSAVEIVAFADLTKPDAVSARLRPMFDHWQDVTGLPDDAVARNVTESGIDILVDLAGHTQGNRLGLFALRPSPVQVSWLGYNATTGLSQIDWRIADPWLVDETSREWFAERIWRLPRPAHCFRPPTDAPPVSAPPVLANGGITFGCFNALAKLSDETLRTWARLMDALPDARLTLKARAGSSRETVDRLRVHGFDLGRVSFLPLAATTAEQYGQQAAIDLALDPWPYNGTTTTCESLWMGVPVLTLAGDRLLGRVGVSLMSALGLDDFVARDPHDYVARAVALAQDRTGLTTLRAELRSRMAASALRDETGFARAMEEAYRGMWQNR